MQDTYRKAIIILVFKLIVINVTIVEIVVIFLPLATCKHSNFFYYNYNKWSDWGSSFAGCDFGHSFFHAKVVFTFEARMLLFYFTCISLWFFFFSFLVFSDFLDFLSFLILYLAWGLAISWPWLWKTTPDF